MPTRISRADALSPKKKQTELFSDFLNSFAVTPIGGNLGRVTNEQSVNQSLRNLMKTNLGDRLFQPFIGSDIYASLFENIDTLILNDIEANIRLTIQNNEPRVNVLDVVVESQELRDRNLSKPDSAGFPIDVNAISVTIVYNLINSTDPITLTTILRRVR